jgi:sulfur carrier protein ThiS adenylyltransferase
MKIRVNEKIVEVQDGIKLFQVKDIFKPNADVIVLNGFPVNEDHVLKEMDQVFLIKKGEVPSQEELEYMMIARHTPGVYEKLKHSIVGIAGLGGLGSNIAIALARIGVGHLIIADFDVVEPSNLNRQQYFIDQIGFFKTEALTYNLRRINPFIKITSYTVKLSSENIPDIFSNCHVIVEAFDRADMKTMLIHTVLEKLPNIYIVAASGLAGYGPNNDIITRRIARKLFVVGDLISEARPGCGLMAPRVGIAAHHQANQVIRILLGEFDEFEREDKE